MDIRGENRKVNLVTARIILSTFSYLVLVNMIIVALSSSWFTGTQVILIAIGLNCIVVLRMILKIRDMRLWYTGPISRTEAVLKGSTVVETIALENALHEASHAVVAHALGLTVEKVSICEGTHNYSNIGYVTIKNDTEISVDRMWSLSIVRAAGQISTYSKGYKSLTNNASDTSMLIEGLTSILLSEERPAVYTGEMTLDGLLNGAIKKAKETLLENDKLINDLAIKLLTEKILEKPFENLKI